MGRDDPDTLRQERMLLWDLERELDGQISLELSRTMAPGDDRHRLVVEWTASLMPWVDLTVQDSNEFLTSRWKERIGKKADGK